MPRNHGTDRATWPSGPNRPGGVLPGRKRACLGKGNVLANLTVEAIFDPGPFCW